MKTISNFIQEHEITLVTLPPPLDVSNASLFLVSQLSLPYFIITWDFSYARSISPNPEKIFSYQDLDSIKDVEGSVFIFDSLPHVQEICELENGAIEGWDVIEHLRSNQNRILILSTFIDLDAERLQLLPSIGNLYLEFADLGNLDFKVEQTIMTKEQLKIFKEERALERDGYLKKTYSSSQQYCNIVYPQKIHKIVSKGSNFTKSNLNLRNAYAIYGGTDLLKNSPKFVNLLHLIFSNRDQKHLIMTRYRKFAGLEILAILLQEIGVPVYELTSSTYDKFGVCQEFSEAREGILICTLVPPTGIRNVRHLHLLDGSLGNFDDFLNALFKHRYYDERPELTVYNHITVSSQIETPDRLGYDKFCDKMKKKMEIWEGEIKKGERVLFVKNELGIVN